jgi:hypothetical protein
MTYLETTANLYAEVAQTPEVEHQLDYYLAEIPIADSTFVNC